MRRLTLLTVITVAASVPASFGAGDQKEASKEYLKAQPAIVIPGGGGAFDWMLVDDKRRCLLAAHKGKGTLEVLDLTSGKLKGSPKVGECQGVAISEKDKLYFAGDAQESKVVILNADTLKIEGEIKVPGEIDAMAYDEKNAKLYVDHDDGDDVWVVDGHSKKIVSTIKVSGMPEYIDVDAKNNKIYQNLKTSNSVAVIDPSSMTIESTWSTEPAQRPHGLAIDEKQQRLYSAGGNGILVSIDLKTGKVISSVKIAPGADQISYDPEKQRLYCACGKKKEGSTISIVDCAAEKLALLQNLTVSPGAHTLAVDPKTHSVWISYMNGTNSYLQCFESVN